MEQALAGWPPRWLSPTTDEERYAGDGWRVTAFVNGLCKITKETVAGRVGQAIVLRPWQVELVDALFARKANGRFRHRQALIGMPRKNGKSALGAGIALYGLLFGPEGGEVFSCAAEKEQAKIVFNMAKRMVELEPDLDDCLTCYRDAIEHKSTGNVYRALSAEAYSKEGLNPSLTVFDEVHAQPNRELWDVMALAMGARVEPMMGGITTAGVMTDNTGYDSLCYSMYQSGIDIARGLAVDESFFFAWWEPQDGVSADHRNPVVWKESNPGFDDIVSADDFESMLRKTPENEFRIKRTNVFTAQQSAWLPFGAWEACVDSSRSPIPDQTPITLGFDGSYNNDSTALIAVTVEKKPHIDVVRVWSKPLDGQADWVVPIQDVEDEIRAACKRWKVLEIDCDAYRWARSLQILEAERLPIIDFPQNPSRMLPATQRFYEAVMNGGLTHSGDSDLARHISHAVVKIDARGTRIAKEAKGSPRKIDLAIAAVMAHDRAAALFEKPQVNLMAAWA